MNWLEKRIFDILLPYFQHQQVLTDKEYIYEVLRTRLIDENKEKNEISTLIQQEESLKNLIKKLNENKKEELKKYDELVMWQKKYKIEEESFDKKIQEVKKILAENEEIHSEQIDILNALKEKVVKENEEIKKINKEKEKNISEISKFELKNLSLDDEINKIIKKELEEYIKEYEEKTIKFIESREHLKKLEELKEESLSETYKTIEDELIESNNWVFWGISQKIQWIKEQTKDTKEQIEDTYNMMNSELSKIDWNFERISKELDSLYADDVDKKKEAKQKAETLVESLWAIWKVRIWNQEVRIKS